MDTVRTGWGRLAQPLALIRPHQWVKNGFVVLGLVFSHRWSEGPLLWAVTCAFLSFCAMASMVYVFNDIVDIESDRLHATKRRRPIASGAVSEPFAKALCAVLGAMSLALAASVSHQAIALVCCYAIMNFAYSYSLKHIVIVDVFVISAGFMLRILVGTLGVGIAPSSWLLLCGMMLTLLIGFGKRRAELMVQTPEGLTTRKVLAQYDLPLLDQFLSTTAACAVLSYSIYTVSPDTVRLHGTDKLVYTVPFIVYGIFRYLYLLTRRGMGQDTSRDLVADKHMLATLVGWVLTTMAILA